MIVKLLLNIIGVFITMIVNIVNTIMPANNLHNNLGAIITTILSVTQQGLNFMYLLFGETLGYVVPIVIGLLLVKYTMAPIVQVLRSVIAKGAE